MTDKEKLNKVLEILNKAWDKEPETLEELGLGDIFTLIAESKRIEGLYAFEVKFQDEPEPMLWSEANKRFGPKGSDPDWRLPTREELFLMYMNKDIIPNLDLEGYYWSSSEYKSFNAWVQRFRDGFQTDCYKLHNKPVRCVRR